MSGNTSSDVNIFLDQKGTWQDIPKNDSHSNRKPNGNTDRHTENQKHTQRDKNQNNDGIHNQTSSLCPLAG